MYSFIFTIGFSSIYNSGKFIANNLILLLLWEQEYKKLFILH